MELELHNKTVFISGSHRGTGEVITKHFIEEGASAIVHAPDQEAAEKSLALLQAKACVWGDLCTDEGAQQVIKQLIDSNLSIDILVNNYGRAEPGRWSTTHPDAWHQLYDINVLSAVRLIQALVEPMKQQKWGRIIQLGTVGSTRPNKVMPHYYAAKGALATLTPSLAKELSGTGITVNTVSPGLIHTTEIEAAYRRVAKKEGWGEKWADIEQAAIARDFNNPCGRMATKAEVADLILFLSSSKANYINGQNIRIDGGAIDIV